MACSLSRASVPSASSPASSHTFPGPWSHLLEPFPYTAPSLHTPDAPGSESGSLGSAWHENPSPHVFRAPPYTHCPATEAFFKVLNWGKG